MRLRHVRAGVALGSAALLPTVQACYDYAPVTTPAQATGNLVELQITDQGRVNLADRFGPGLDRIRGRLVSQQDSTLVIDVYGVTHLTGGNADWSGESVTLDRSVVGSIKGRKISTARTALIALAVGAVLYLTAGRALVGSYASPDDDPEPIDPPAKIRMPIRP